MREYESPSKLWSYRPIGEFVSEEVFSGSFVYGRVFPAGDGYLAVSKRPIGRHYAPSFFAASKEAAVSKLVAAVAWDQIRVPVMAAAAKAKAENDAFVAGREEVMAAQAHEARMNWIEAGGEVGGWAAV